MSVETADFIQQLSENDPPGSDPRKQGDDHIRLIKKVLKETFPNMDRAFYRPAVVFFDEDSTLQLEHENSTVMVNTGGGDIAVLLPVLTEADGGFSCTILKSTTANTLYIRVEDESAFASGEYTVTQARREIAGVPIRAFWSGFTWFVERAHRLPVCTVQEFWGEELPRGYLWADGDSFDGEVYQEAFVGLGDFDELPDRRGTVAAGRDNLGGTAANRLGDQIDGEVLGAIDGDEVVTLTWEDMPVHNHNVSHTDAGHAHGYNTFNNQSSKPGGAGSSPPDNAIGATTGSSSSNITIHEDDAGEGDEHSNLQPTTIMNFIVLVE